MRPIFDTNTHDPRVPAPSYTAYNSDGELITEENDHSVDVDVTTEQLIIDFQEKINDFSSEVINRLKNDFTFYKAPVTNFIKNIGRVTNGTDGMFSKLMYSFASEVNFAATKGEKKQAKKLE